MNDLTRSFITLGIVILENLKRKELKKNVRISNSKKRVEVVSQNVGQVEQEKEISRNNLENEEGVTMLRMFKNTFDDRTYEIFIKETKSLLAKEDVRCIYTFRCLQRYLIEHEDTSLLWSHFYKIYDMLRDAVNNEEKISYILNKINEAYDAFVEKYPDVEVPIFDVDFILSNMESFTFEDAPNENIA